MKSEMINESDNFEKVDNNFVSIKGIKIPSQNKNEKEEKMDYFDLYNNNSLNEEDALQEN